MSEIGRRGFLGSIAALLPSVAIAKAVTEKGYTEKPEKKKKTSVKKKKPKIRSRVGKLSHAIQKVGIEPNIDDIDPGSALKADRWIKCEDLSFFYNGECISRGRVVCLDSNQDDDGFPVVDIPNKCKKPYPVGIIMNDVVNLDMTRQHINWHKEEVPQGGKVCIAKYGYLTIKPVKGNPQPGKDLYYDDIGYLTTEEVSKCVGKVTSSLDADGFCRVDIHF